MSSLNYGIGYVSPDDGLDTANGYGMDTPKRTLTNAISSGFRHIIKAEGVDAISTIGELMTIELTPGDHSWSNAPVLLDNDAINLISTNRRPPAMDGTGAAIITAPSVVNSFFYQRTTNVIRSGMFAGCFYDMSKIANNKYALDLMSTWTMLRDNVVYAPAWGNRWLHYTETVAASDGISWDRWLRNYCYNAGLFYRDPAGNEPDNRTTIRDNVMRATGSGATMPFWRNEHGRTQDQDISGNSVINVAAGTKAGVETRRGKRYSVFGNFADQIKNTGNFWLEVKPSTGYSGPEGVSSHIIHCIGPTIQGGRVKVNDAFPSAGGDSYDSTYENHFDIIDFKDNL